MFGWKDDAERGEEARLCPHGHPLKPVEIAPDEAPCQEHVDQGRRTSTRYLVPIRHTTYEPELTIGSGIRSSLVPEFDGGSDLGYDRMNFRWGNVGTFQISPGSHMWQVVNKYYKSESAGSDHHVLRRAAGPHAARRGRLDYAVSDGLRRDRHCRALLSSPPASARPGAGRW